MAGSSFELETVLRLILYCFWAIKESCHSRGYLLEEVKFNMTKHIKKPAIIGS